MAGKRLEGPDAGLFRGFIHMGGKDGKQALMKFKDVKDLPSREDAARHDAYAGVLSEKAVLLDFDDMGQADVMLKIVDDLQLDCRVVRTDHGRHFYFLNDGNVKKCATKARLACGLTADIKIGPNSYAVQKRAGKERPVEYDIVDEQDSPIGGATGYQALPCWLRPVKTDIDLLGMKEGDGRNEALYSYILALLRNGFTKEECRDTLRMANRYVFAQPMDEKELETVMRDEAFPQEESGGRWRFDEFARRLVSSAHAVMLNGQLHVWKDGGYSAETRDVEAAMIREKPDLTAARRLEVYKYMELIAPTAAEAEPALVAFANGVLDMRTMRLQEPSPDVIITNRIPWDWSPDARSPLLERTLDKIADGDKEVRLLLEECAGYCLYRSNALQKAFIFKGDRANGKSTFVDMVRDFLGERNCSALDVAEFEERFSVAELAGKLANIGDDISDDFLRGRPVSIFKRVVTGNEIKGEFKGLRPFKFTPYCKVLLSANDLPRTKDRTGAVLRRMVIVPFDRTFSPSDPDYDPDIGRKLAERPVMEAFAVMAVRALERLLSERRFVEPRRVTQALREYEEDNNPILAFFAETDVERDILNQTTDEVYRRYRVFAIENGYGEMTKTSFSKELRRRLDVETRVVKIDGKPFRIYQKV